MQTIVKRNTLLKALVFVAVVLTLSAVCALPVLGAEEASFSITVDGSVIVEYSHAELMAKLGTPVTAAFAGEKVTGLPVAEFMHRLGMEQNGSVVAVKTTDYTGPAKSLSQYISDGDFIAWEVNGVAVGDGIGGKIYNLRLYDAEAKMYKGVMGVDAIPVYNWRSYPEVIGVRNFISDDKGGLWIGATVGLFYLDAAGNLSRKYETLLDTQWVYDLALDSTANLWVTQGFSYQFTGGTDPNKGFIKFSPMGEKLAQYTVESTGGKLPNNFVQALSIDSKDRVWLGHFPGPNGEALTMFDPATDTWTSWKFADGLATPSVNTLVADSLGGMWIAGYPSTQDGTDLPPYSGGYSYIDANGKIYSWIYSINDDPSLNGNYMGDFWSRGIAVDARDGAWITRSTGEAIAYFYLGGPDELVLEDCVGGHVDYIYPDKAKIDMYTGRQLSEEINDGIFAERDPQTGAVLRGATPEARAIAVDVNDGLWLGTAGIGVIYQAMVGETTRHYSYQTFDWPSVSTTSDSIRNLYVADNGTVYVGATGGLMVKNFPELAKEAAVDTTPVAAMANSSKVLVNGKEIQLEAYTINDLNYFKLRDLAFVLSGTEAQFEAAWDETRQSVALTAGKSYTVIGGELSLSGSIGAMAVRSTHKLYIDGNPASPDVYNIDGYNYFKLRDLGELLNFLVDWNPAGIIEITTK